MVKVDTSCIQEITMHPTPIILLSTLRAMISLNQVSNQILYPFLFCNKLLYSR